jgi:K+-sensing histidine kinase KdpD
MISEEDLKRQKDLSADYFMFISQEISTSLNGIMGALNLIKNHEHTASMKELVESLDNSVARLEKFTFKVMLSNQLNLNEYKLQWNELSLKDLIHYSILEINDITQKNNIKIKTDKISDNIILKADEDLIFKAFNYILANAVKYTPRNGSIDVKVITSDKLITCSISDSGPGFSEEAIRSLFHPFQFYENATQTKGLSLYLVKQIMDLHHGTINVFNNQDGGACIELVFRSGA